MLAAMANLRKLLCKNVENKTLITYIYIGMEYFLWPWLQTF